jgi:hypothetical protein
MCSGCKLVKFYALPFNRSIFVSFSPFDLIYSDVKEPFHAAIKRDSWYYGFFFFIDDHTCYC